ncbi:MAG: cytochrome c biogenesis protein CcsA, partial [Chitinophagales bacterium]|nr:cytochrome c biogenesis protein CcsA [Chitinophagales bacterium]MDW8274463.1 cytochrome c biogenesis protein CcsA [Chitinophagales bacterium]
MFSFITERFDPSGYVGEHLWLGHLGHFFLLLSFFAALVAFVSYFAAEYASNRRSELAWRKLSRCSFFTHGFSVLGIFTLLFIMILNHWFEYHYAWRHSSRELPVKYIISSFWEGQEGSFLLWQFWIVVLGFICIKKLREWEYPVMGILSLTQVFLGSMVLGIYVLGYKIGSNPFTLLRDEMADAPIFQRPNYLSFIADGNGLNPLLQNYWMTIHPPVLFLGFASVSIPFSFTVAALLRKDFKGWVKPALPWTLFSIAALGTGILMGGAWAYESLSFGGFWAWDPVENMSLVPWLLLVAALHTHVIYKNTGHSLLATLLFYIFCFITVLYSTFLTRSGILGDTSVHAFTDLGMSGQLVIYMAAFALPSLGLLVMRLKNMPGKEEEEEWKSREFWMFIGALVMLLSAIQMIFTTSIPVWNKLFGLNMAPPENVVAHYNNVQIWIGIVMAALTALVQYLAYKSNRLPRNFSYAIYAFMLSAVISVALGLALKISFTEQYLLNATKINKHLFLKFNFISRNFLLLLTSVYAAVGNLFYLIFVVKWNWRVSGASVTHFGFGVFLIGVLISQGKKEVISLNTAGVDFGPNFKENEKAENILLLKDSLVKMGNYLVRYKGMEQQGPNNFYLVEYVRKDNKGKIKENFILKPNAQINPKMGLISNPDTRHYLTKDVFTHVSSVPNNETLRDSMRVLNIAIGDTFFNLNSFTVFQAVNTNPVLPAGISSKGKVMAAPILITKNLNGDSFRS